MRHTSWIQNPLAQVKLQYIVFNTSNCFFHLWSECDFPAKMIRWMWPQFDMNTEYLSFMSSDGKYLSFMSIQFTIAYDHMRSGPSVSWLILFINNHITYRSEMKQTVKWPQGMQQLQGRKWYLNSTGIDFAQKWLWYKWLGWLLHSQKIW